MRKVGLVAILLSATIGCSGDFLPQFSRTESKENSTLTNIVDVDGDRKPDIVFAVSESKKIQAGSSDVTLRRYFVFVRRNTGSGNYAPPQFLFVTDKEEAMKGIPYEDVDRDVFKDPKRSEYLKGLISNVSY